MSPRITPAERRALLALDRHVPRHPEDLWRRDQVRSTTLHRMQQPLGDRPRLVLRLELKPSTWLKAPYTPFYVLTDEGVAACARMNSDA